MKNPISPELAAQLVDQADADKYSAGSNVKLRWRCPDNPRHIWEAAPNTRRRSPACPVCANKIILAGVNDLATTHPELTAELADPAVGATVGAGSHTKGIWRCLSSGNPSHIWQTSVVQRTRSGSGCPFCSGRIVIPGVNDLATLHPNLAAQLVDPRQAIGVSPGSPKKLLWRCLDDDTHAPWEAPVRNRVGSASKPPTSCPHCSGHAKRKTPTADATRVTRASRTTTLRITEGYGDRVWLTPDEWETYRRRPPVRYNAALLKKARLRGDACAHCGTSDGTLQLAHRVPFIVGVIQWGLTPDWLDRPENLAMAHRGSCNNALELDDEQIAELLHAAGINIADSPVAAEPHLRRFLDDA